MYFTFIARTLTVVNPSADIQAADIIIAIAVFLTLAVGMIILVVLYTRRVVNHQVQLREFHRQKEIELMQAAIRGEEEERIHIASELHDDVGATLASIRLFLTQAEENPGNVQLVSYSKRILDESIQKVRNLSHQLQPRTLHFLGLARGLESLADLMSRSATLQVSYSHESGCWLEPDSQTALAAYRIVQELITNIIKHAGATWIQVTTSVLGMQQTIRISHNGKGLSEADYQQQLYKQGAIGLKNIENRLKSLGLQLVFPNSNDPMYILTIVFPKLID